MNLFELDALETAQSYPKLALTEKLGLKILSGEIDLLSNNGEILDTYQIEIHPSDKYPYEFPLVFETGGRLPIDIDWHVYEQQGNCCIKVPPEEMLICLNGIKLSLFIADQLLPYLFNQTFRIENGYYINERSHGVKGLIEFFEQYLKTNDIKTIIVILGNILFRPEPDRVSVCFCGSKQKYRYCHREAYRSLSKINKERLLMFLKLIKEYR